MSRTFSIPAVKGTHRHWTHFVSAIVYGSHESTLGGSDAFDDTPIRDKGNVNNRSKWSDNDEDTALLLMPRVVTLLALSDVT